MAKLTYFGHSTLLLELENVSILFDPFISGNPLAAEVNISEIQPDFILLSHGHQDHILDVEQIAQQSDATIIANYEVATHFANKGLKTIPMNHGGTITTEHFSTKYVNAVHTSSFPDGSYAGQPGGFVVYNDTHRIYFAGDTALTYDMKLIGEEFDLDLAILPIGGHFTMDYKDAIKAAKFVSCTKVMGIHYDTFEPIAIDKEVTQTAFENENIDLFLLDILQELSIEWEK